MFALFTNNNILGHWQLKFIIRSSKRRYKLKRDHAGASNEELNAILERPEVATMSKRGDIKPFFCRDMVSESETQSWRLVSELPVEDLEGIAFVFFREDSAPAFCLGVQEESREDDAYVCIKSMMDLWSLRRPGLKHMRRCQGVLDVYKEMEPLAELYNMAKEFLDDSDGSKRTELANEVRVCDVCGYSTQITSMRALHNFNSHYKKHFYNNYKCDCKVTWTNNSEKFDHVRLHHMTGYTTCAVCGYVTKESQMSNHMAREHVEGTCEWCGITTNNRSEMVLHMKNEHPEHATEHETPAYLKKGGRKPKYSVPYMSKEKSEPMVCKKCGKTFESQYALSQHLLIHIKMTCNVCGEVFEGRNKLRVHKRNSHDTVSGGKAAYPCDMCGKSMVSEKKLEEHMFRIHVPDNERPFPCSMCDRGFARKSELTAHMSVTHLRTRPYACGFKCGQAFNHFATRRDHEKSRHGMTWNQYLKAQAQANLQGLPPPQVQGYPPTSNTNTTAPAAGAGATSTPVTTPAAAPPPAAVVAAAHTPAPQVVTVTSQPIVAAGGPAVATLIATKTEAPFVSTPPPQVIPPPGQTTTIHLQQVQPQQQHLSATHLVQVPQPPQLQHLQPHPPQAAMVQILQQPQVK